MSHKFFLTIGCDMEATQNSLPIERQGLSGIEVLNMLVELGETNYYLLNFSKAERFFKSAIKYSSTGEVEKLSSAYRMLIRISAEVGDFEQGKLYQESYRDFLSSLDHDKYQSQYLTLEGLHYFYNGDYSNAKNSFSESANLALIKSGKTCDWARASFGLASTLYRMGSLSSSERILRSINREGNNGDISENVSVMLGLIYKENKEYDKALVVFEEVLKLSKKKLNWFLYYSTKFNMAMVVRDKGDIAKAYSILEELYDSTKDTGLVVFNKMVGKEFNDLKNVEEIILDEDNRTLVALDGTTVNFGNKMTPFDILKFLVENKGSSVSKEQLCRKVWGSEFDPFTDDNKIFYNINRLRKLLKPFDKGNSSTILKTKSGYAFDPNVSVKFKGKL